MIKPSVDTDGLISNYIDTTSITIPLPVAFVTSGTSFKIIPYSSSYSL